MILLKGIINVVNKEISKVLKQWKRESGVDGIILVGAFPEVKDSIKLCSNRPDLLIGNNRNLINKYKKDLKRICPSIKRIELIDTKNWYVP